MEHTDIKLEDTKLSSLYFHEMWWLAHGIKVKAERLFEATKLPDKGYYMQVDPELHSLIASMLSDAANLKKLIVTPGNRSNGESGSQFRLRKARAAALRKAIEGISVTEMFNAKVRNTLEHFDEYLDEVNISLKNTKKAPSPVAAYNIVISHWEVTNPRVYPIRLYVASERKFYNMKWNVDIGSIYQEATAVAERLALHLKASTLDQPGGLLLSLS